MFVSIARPQPLKRRGGSRHVYVVFVSIARPKPIKRQGGSLHDYAVFVIIARPEPLKRWGGSRHAYAVFIIIARPQDLAAPQTPGRLAVNYAPLEVEIDGVVPQDIFPWLIYTSPTQKYIKDS